MSDIELHSELTSRSDGKPRYVGVEDAKVTNLSPEPYGSFASKATFHWWENGDNVVFDISFNCISIFLAFNIVIISIMHKLSGSTPLHSPVGEETCVMRTFSGWRRETGKIGEGRINLINRQFLSHFAFYGAACACVVLTVSPEPKGYDFAFINFNLIFLKW